MRASINSAIKRQNLSVNQSPRKSTSWLCRKKHQFVHQVGVRRMIHSRGTFGLFLSSTHPQSTPTTTLCNPLVRNLNGPVLSSRKKKQKKSRPVDVDRKVLASRFKNTVERTLQRRLESMGVENSGAVPTTQFRRVMDQLELTQQKSGREFERTRRRFLAELQCRTDPSSDKKSDTPKVKNKKKASSQMVAVTPSPSAGNRAPVPTPRTGRMSHLMARDGEASSVNVKDLTRNLEHKVFSIQPLVKMYYVTMPVLLLPGGNPGSGRWPFSRSERIGPLSASATSFAHLQADPSEALG